MRDTGFSAQQVQTGLECIRELAQEPRTRFSTKDMVAEWFDEIEAALEKHSYAVIAERLQDRAGLSIAPGTLKNNYLKLKKERSGTKRRTPKTRKRTASKTDSELSIDTSQGTAVKTSSSDGNQLDSERQKSERLGAKPRTSLPVSDDEIKLAY